MNDQRPEIVDLEGTLYEYVPCARQREFHTSGHHERLYGGAWGGGKTRGLCQEAFALCSRFPGIWGFLCRKDSVDFSKTVLEPVLLRQVLHPKAIRRHNQQDQRIQLVNGSEIWYGGANDFEKIQGQTWGFVGIDQVEQIEYEIYKNFLARLRQVGVRRCIFSTANPAPGWVKDRFIPPGGTRETYISGNRIYIPARISDNPGLPADYESQLRTEHDSIWVKRFVEGDWASFSGAVYQISGDQIKPRSDLYRRSDPVFISVDFGFRRAAVLWIQVRGEDICVIHELAIESATTGDMGRRVAEINRTEGFSVNRGYCDPAGAARNVQTGISDMEEFRRSSGIGLISPGNKVLRDVVVGVQRLQARIKDATGKPHLFIARECKWLLTCIENYCYPDPKVGHELKEEPIKDGLHDHALDALRYFEIGQFPVFTTRLL